jgi:hypothetical protein
VTELTPELPVPDDELPDADELEVDELVAGVLVVVVAELVGVVPLVVERPAGVVVDGVVVAELADALVLEREPARAGSWPLTSSSVISIQVVTNRVRAPATTRRRIMFTRAIRAWRTPDGARLRPESRPPGTLFRLMSILFRRSRARNKSRPSASQRGVDCLRRTYEAALAPIRPRSKRQPLK